jgi:hypothetical protein
MVRKPLIAIFILLFALSLSVSLYESESDAAAPNVGSNITVDGVTYKVLSSSTVEVGTGSWLAISQSYTGDLYIPSAITYTDSNGDPYTYDVVRIGAGAFQSTNLNSLTLGSSESPMALSTILSAFFSSNVKSITIYTSVATDIASGAFNSSKVETVEIYGSIGSLNSSAFHGCTSLSSFYVTGSIGEIYSGAFQSTSTPFTFTVLGDITTIHSSAFYSSSIQYFTVGGSVDTIENNVFQSTTSLVSVNMGSIDSIGTWAFGGSTLKYITLSNDTTIAHDSFQSSQLSEVYITDAGTSSSGDILSTYFSSSPWSIGNATIDVLILDDISNISGIGNGGTIIYYDKENDTCSTYTVVDGEWTESPSGTTTVVVVFEPQSDSVSVSSAIITPGSTVTFPTVYKVGYELIGWFSQPSGGVQYTSSTGFTSNTVVYAQWRSAIAAYHTVTYDENGGSIPAPTQEDVLEGSTFTVAPYDGTNTGYAFIGWSDGTQVYFAGSTYTMGSSDVTLTAVWDGEYTVYILGEGNVYISINGSSSFVTGSSFTMTSRDYIVITCDEGYDFETYGFTDSDSEYWIDSGSGYFCIFKAEELAFVFPSISMVQESCLFGDDGSAEISRDFSVDGMVSILYSYTFGADIDVTFDGSTIDLDLEDGSVRGCLPILVVLSDADGTHLMYCNICAYVISDSRFIIPS